MRKLINLSLCLIILLSSCKKFEIIPVEQNQIQEANAKWDKAVNETAKKVQELTKLKSFREYLKAEVLKRFDGDYDVLISKIVKDYKNSSSVSVNSNQSNSEVNWPPYSLAFLEEISQQYPLMQLSVQVDPTTWDPNYLPNVVYITADYNEDNTTLIPGFDFNGNTIFMDATIDPILPVIIVGGNERGYVDDNQNFYLFDAYIGEPIEITQSDSLQPINPSQPLLWYRQNFKYESIYAMKYEELGKIEGWPAGAPETRVFTYHVDPFDSTKVVRTEKGTFEPSRRKLINNTWWDCGVNQMHLWRWDYTGTIFKYAVYEYDFSPISSTDWKELGNLTGSVLSSIPNLNGAGAASAAVKFIFNLQSLALPKENHKSEFVGEVDISANNNAIEFGMPGGKFRFKTKPY